MATIKDVAQAAQVSAAAVSRVLNKDENISVSPEVRVRIFQAAHALGYISPRQRKAAEHKKHVFCEKPIALNYRDCDEMVKAAEKNGKDQLKKHSQSKSLPKRS